MARHSDAASVHVQAPPRGVWLSSLREARLGRAAGTAWDAGGSQRSKASCCHNTHPHASTHRLLSQKHTQGAGGGSALMPLPLLLLLLPSSGSAAPHLE